MRVLDKHEAAQELAKSLGKYVLYVAPYWDLDHEVQDAFSGRPDLRFKSAPYLNFKDHSQQLLDGEAVIVCESKEEMNALFEQTVGDDGPTEQNNYDGPHRTYALTISNEGVLWNENT